MAEKKLPSEVLHLWATLFILPLSDEDTECQNFLLLAFSLLVFICFGKGWCQGHFHILLMELMHWNSPSLAGCVGKMESLIS